jgi:hypothetical protein
MILRYFQSDNYYIAFRHCGGAVVGMNAGQIKVITGGLNN